MNSKPRKAPDSAPRRKIPRRISESYLHNAGLFYLQRFAASSARFREVMMRKVRKSCRAHPDQDPGRCRELVEALVARFEQAGLLNDEAYTRGVAASMRRQGKSRQAILSKLKARGIQTDQADEQLAAIDEMTPGAELRAALAFARKKKIGPFRLRGESAPEKELAALGRAGFSYDTARRVLQKDVGEVPFLEEI